MTVAAHEIERGPTDGLPTRRLFDVREYHAMARAGILHRDEKLELIEGTIIRKRASPPVPRLFDVDEYYAIARAGILGDDDRVELIEGEIVVMSPAFCGRRRRVGSGGGLEAAAVAECRSWPGTRSERRCG